MAVRHGILNTVVFTMHSGGTVTAADTALDKPLYGTGALNAFKRGDKVIEIGGENPCYLNWYAIEKACVTAVNTSEEYTDEMCAAGESA